MMHKTNNFELHMNVIYACIERGVGFVATEDEEYYYIEFTGAY